MTQGASAFPRPAERPVGRLDVAWKWKTRPEPERGFVMWEFRGEPFASEEELRLKLAVMGLELAGEDESLRGTYSLAYRVVPGPGVSGEEEAGGGRAAAKPRNSLGENAV